jgi:hypothetical protein
VANAIARARERARGGGNRDIGVGPGRSVVDAPRADLLDAPRMDVVPVLLGGGTPTLPGLGDIGPIGFEQVAVTEESVSTT